MNLIDLSTFTEDVSPKYIGVPQPMYVYHSTEEFEENVKDYILIKNIFQFYNFIKENKIEEPRWHNIYQKNVWLATNEKHIPIQVDIYGSVTYKLDNNKPVPTDNCYIRLCSLQVFKYTYLLWTSSGLYNVSLKSWELSAGIKTQFMKTRISKETGYKPYPERLEKALGRKKSTVRDMQFLLMLINPLSDAFLDTDACFRRVFPEIRKKDRDKYLNTDRFKKLFVQQLGKLMPELVKGIQKHNTPDDIGEYLKKMREAALEKGSTQDQIEALNVALKLGYADKIIHTGNDLKALEDNKFTPLISENAPNLIGQGNIGQHIIDEDDKVKDEDEVKAPPENASELETYDDGDVEMNQEEYNQAMHETGAIDGFVIEDEEDEKR
jgi:hypothetical protein